MASQTRNSGYVMDIAGKAEEPVWILRQNGMLNKTMCYFCLLNSMSTEDFWDSHLYMCVC